MMFISVLLAMVQLAHDIPCHCRHKLEVAFLCSLALAFGSAALTWSLLREALENADRFYCPEGKSPEAKWKLRALYIC
jgi:hypothetical protein